jgi:effector-binding domain-containing protein
MPEFEDLESAEVEVAPTLVVQVPGRSAANPAEISKAMGVAFGELMGVVQRHKLVPSGPPRAIYTSHGAEGVKFLVVVPITSPPAEPIEDGPGSVDTLAGTKALRFTHHGSYKDLMQTYGRITEFMKARGLMQSEADWARYMPMWEEYLNDPHTTPETDLLTYIYLPVS